VCLSLDLLQLSVWFETDERVRVTLRDASRARWEIPAPLLRIESRQPPASSPSSPLYSFAFTKSPFSFSITRISTGERLFDTAGAPLFYSDQFLQFSTALPPDSSLYGLGERMTSFRLPQADFIIWYTTGAERAACQGDNASALCRPRLTLPLSAACCCLPRNTDWGNPALLNLYGHHPVSAHAGSFIQSESAALRHRL
jgi:alpha-glucosidase (family GH31 glycosyl hydrolase)